MQEVRLAVRALRRAPLFTAIAVVSLALGIGANTAMFTLVDQVLLRLLPVREPRELVQLRIEGGRFGNNSGDGIGTFSHPLYLALRDRNTVLSGLTGQQVTQLGLSSGDRSDAVSTGLVAGNFFEVLGLQPHTGRLLTGEDDKVKGAHPVAVLQYDFWRQRFAGNPHVVGSTIRLNGIPFTVVGVGPAGFVGTDNTVLTRMWVPVMMRQALTPTADDLENERSAWFYLFGRLKPGVSREQAEAHFKTIYAQRQQEELQGEFFQRFPDTRERFLKQSFLVAPASRGDSNIRRRFEQPLIVLECLVGLVLLIACANVANLLLARAAARQREVAIRTALGAGRWRIVRQLLLESLVLAVAGGIAGLVLAAVLARALLRFLPFDPANMALSTTPDLRVLSFSAALTLATAFLFGLMPALQASRSSPASTLKAEAGSVAGGRGHVRLRKTLVGVQVGLATVLLIGAGLFVRTLRELRGVDLGLRSENVVTMGVRPAVQLDDARKRQVFRTLVESLGTVPGVKAVGANSARLFMGGRWDSQVTVPGVGWHEGRPPWSYFNAVTPGYFDALGIPVKAGRDFNWNDWGAAEERALVNEKFVEDYLKGEVPVGRRMAQGRDADPNIEIIGVFGNANYDNVRGTVPRQTFVSMGSGNRIRAIGALVVYARTDRDPRIVMPALRAQVRQVDPDLMVADLRTLDDQLDMRLSNERMLSFLAAGFAVLATVLAVVGLYGVLSFVVTRRTREIGIRMALGADRRNVVRLVMVEMLALFVFGVAAGVFAAVAGGRYVESQLFGVHANDPIVFTLSAVMLFAAALAAAFLPAWRAAQINPIRALRYE
jgi:predicted permease